MQFIVFTKMFKECSLEKLIEKVHHVGADGMDFCVRPGYPVEPETVADTLYKAVEQITTAGLSVPMLTANFDFTDPAMPETEPMLKAMHAADVRLIKLGYYAFTPGEMDYWAEVAEIRRRLKVYADLAAAYNVKICYHTHSDLCMGNNASGLMTLIKGLPQEHIGAYLDTAHIVIDGEPWPMALDIVGEYLSIVAAKDFRYLKDDNQPARIEWVPAGQGLVDWQGAFRELAKRNYDGPISIHGEFEQGFTTQEEFYDMLKKEVTFIRSIQQSI